MRIIALDIDDSLLAIICTITITVRLTARPDVPTVSMAESCVPDHNESPNCPNLGLRLDLSPERYVGIIREIQITDETLGLSHIQVSPQSSAGLLPCY